MRRTRDLQNGAALLVMLAIVLMGSTYLLLNGLGWMDLAASRTRDHNAKVMNQAKQALIGYTAQLASRSSEGNPGRLLCPEAPGNFGTANEGIAAGNCALPAVGRLPWRTLGLDKLADASGEPLWYVVSAGWALSNATLPPLTTIINSNSSGQLDVDGIAGDSVALIIAPGPAFSTALVPAAGCIAWSQSRPTTGPPDLRNYLECANATSPADQAYATTGPAGAFNDQVLRVTAADLLPAIEAAIAHRIERQIAPLIRNAYSSAPWAATTVLPFAAAFADPANPATSLKGVAGVAQGLLPLTRATDGVPGIWCTGGGACDPDFVRWRSVPAPNLIGPTVYSSSCSVASAGSPATTRVNCTFEHIVPVSPPPPSAVNFTLLAIADNVGMTLRQFDTSVEPMTGVSTFPRTATAGLVSDGSAAVFLSASADSAFGAIIANADCGLPDPDPNFACQRNTVSVPISLLADHPLLNPDHPTLGWFLRNRWHEVSYYAIAPGIAPDGPRSCTTGGTCLSVAFHPQDGRQRGIILLSGRSLTGAARPNGSLADWLEGANSGGVSPFATRSPAQLVNRTFNDRVAVLDVNP